MEDPVEKYYKIKGKYDKKYKDYKKEIMGKTNLSKIQKKARISNYKRRCINCDRKVGTVFTNKNKQLSIRCGDTLKPCNLEYIVSLGSTDYIPDLIVYYYKVNEEIKKNIIKIKLSILFGIETEENIAEKFETLKEQYKQMIQILDNLERYIFDDEKVKYQEMGEEHDKHRDQAIKFFKKKITNYISEYNSIINSFKEDLDDKFILNDALDKYRTEIIPIVKEMQSKFFDVMTIIDDDKEEGKKRLVKLVLSEDKYEVDYSKSEVVIDKK